MSEPRAWWKSRSLLAALGVGLVLRVGAAFVVDGLAQREGRVCLFPDAAIYWQLAGSISSGGPYRVSQWGVPHDALRTPGFPLFLAACRLVAGDATLPPRLAQAVLGTLAIGLVARLTWLVRPVQRLAIGAAWLAALDPFVVGFTPLLLSEAVFLPLLLATLVGLATLWRGPASARVALLTGLTAGAAVLVKPSFALFVPAVLTGWLACAPRASTARGAALVALGLTLIMAPWWARNAWHYHRFVGTALWGGASLYDGLNPRATGASDMTFLEAEDLRELDEVTQDQELKRRAWTFACERPDHVAALAGVKAARFWSPWLNAEGARSTALAVATTLWTLPVYLAILAGLARWRRDARAWALLAGPLLYFAVLHMVFVGSVRYRAPAIVPAFGLAARGLLGWGGRGPDEVDGPGLSQEGGAPCESRRS